MKLVLMILWLAYPLLGSLGWALQISLVDILGLKSIDFQGPTLRLALVMDIARLKIIASRA